MYEEDKWDKMCLTKSFSRNTRPRLILYKCVHNQFTRKHSEPALGCFRVGALHPVVLLLSLETGARGWRRADSTYSKHRYL